MKILKSILLFSLCLFIIGCSHKKESLKDLTEIPCVSDCLFTVNEGAGKITFMNCFQKFAVQSTHPDNNSITIYGILDSVEEKYKEEGMEIVFSGAFKANTLQPLFPDPSFDMESIYETSLMTISSKN